jgi:hypothetical protein
MMAVLTQHAAERAETPVPALAARARAALGHTALDRLLAEGDNVAGPPELPVRAWQITRPKARERVAGALEEILADAQRPRAARCAICREEVEVARGELLRLAMRLRDTRPVHARGVALARRLLSDRSGPLYAPARNDELWRQARRAAAALD